MPDASQDRQPEIQSTLMREDFERIVEQTNKDFRFRNFTLTKFPTPTTFVCWEIRFKTEVCTCLNFLTEAMLWIKEVEPVEPMDDLKSSCSIRGIQMPNFELLDTRIASALNKITQNTRFQKKVSVDEQKAQKRGPFPSWKTNRLRDLRALPGHWSQRSCRELCRLIYN